VILLLELAAAAYFVFRVPDRTRDQITNVSAGSSTPTPSGESAAKLPENTDNQQVSEDKKKAADAKKQTDQDAAAVEAQKKAAETREKTARKESTEPSPPEPKPAVPPPPAATSEPAPDRSNATGRDGCILVTVLDVNGDAVPGARVNIEGTMLRGRTGPKGRWQDCGLTVGQSIKVLVMGPMGAMIGSQTAVVAPRTFVSIRLDRAVNRAPNEPQPPNPGRKRPFPGKP